MHSARQTGFTADQESAHYRWLPGLQLLACTPALGWLGMVGLFVLPGMLDHPLRILGSGAAAALFAQTLMALAGAYGLVRAILSAGQQVPRLALACGFIPAAPMLVALAAESDFGADGMALLQLLWCSLSACLGLALYYLLQPRRG